MKPLIYLELRELSNSVKYAFRNPKRLLPLLIFFGWVFLSIAQSIFFMTDLGGRRQQDLELLAKIPLDVIHATLVLLILTGSAALLWSVFGSGIMVFSVSHIDFLFPLPISRRAVLVTKLLKDYAKYGVSVAFLYLVFGSVIFAALDVALLPWGLVSVAGLTALIVAVVNVAHVLNIVFTFGLERLRALGLVAKTCIVGVPACGLMYVAASYVGGDRSLVAAVSLVRAPLLTVVFAPASWCAGLLLAPLNGIAVPEDFVKLGALWLIAAASFVALLVRKENIYEPALGVSLKFARWRAVMRGGDRSGLVLDRMRETGVRRIRAVVLPPFGRGAVAFVWKNLLIRLRMSRTQTLLILLLPILVIYIVRIALPHGQLVAGAPWVLLYLIWAMSMMALSDIRAEFRYANITKPIPIPGWKLMLAQVTSSLIFITATELLFGGAMLVLMPQTRTAFALATLACAPFLTFATLSAVFIAGVLYPDMRDVAQNYLCATVSSLLASVALVPGTVAAAILIRWTHLSLIWSVSIASGIFIATGIVGVALAGHAFEKFEPVGE